MPRLFSCKSYVPNLMLGCLNTFDHVSAQKYEIKKK